MSHLRLTRVAIAMLAGCSSVDQSPGNVVPAKRNVTVSLTGNGSGRVRSGAGEIDCGATCSAAVNISSNLTLTAQPDAGSNFIGWSGACSGSGSCDVVADADKQVTARFDRAAPPPQGKHLLSVVINGLGSVSSTPAGIDCGAVCSASFDENTSIALVPAAAPGFRFDGWGGGCRGGGGCTITLVSDLIVYATFASTAPQSFTLTVSNAGAGTGSIKSNPDGIDCPTTCSAKFLSGTAVALTATPATDSRFSGWSSACSGTGGCTVTMNGDAAAAATFDKVAADECAGLAPADPGDPRTVAIKQAVTGTFLQCFRGTADGSGTLALGYATSSQPFTGHFGFLAPDGTVRSTQSYLGLNTPYPQLAGFEGLARESASWGVLALASDGRQVNHASNIVGSGLSANDPTGGMVIDNRSSIQTYDAAGNVRWTVSISDISQRLYALGVDRTGQVLLLFEGAGRFAGGSVAGLWITHDGQRGSIFSAIDQKFADTILVIAPRVGSGLFVQERSPLGGNWVRQIDSLATSGSPPPSWLAQRGGWVVHFAHNGTTYAMTPTSDAGSSPGPKCRLDVIAATGKTCGTVVFNDPSGSCESGNLEVGYDGTLVQLLASSTSGCQRDCACTWRWWSGYLH